MDKLGDLYKDLFTGFDSKPQKTKESRFGKSVKDLLEPGAEVPSEKDVLQNAQNVLDEAKKLLEEEPEIEKTQQTPESAVESSVDREEKKEKEEKDPMEQLEELIGLSAIKHDVKELTDFAKVQKLRKDSGLKSVPVSLHLVFTGNPGTGKTTVARILAKIYKNIGILSKGQLVEVDRSGLVAGYVGQTAIKTQKKIQEALGGILFIDEAYALSQKDDAFGQEAIDTILKAMEDNRDDFVVIVAGYTKPMEQFIHSNPGLQSRFNKYMEFPDYSLDELEQIFDMNCKKYDYTLEEDAKHQIRELIKLRMLKQPDNFANAREVRNLFEEIITNQARRLAEMDQPDHAAMTTILLEDLSDCEEASQLKSDTQPDSENPPENLHEDTDPA